MSGQFASALVEKGGAQARANPPVPHVPRFAHSLSLAALTAPGDAFEQEADRFAGEAMRRKPTQAARSLTSGVLADTGREDGLLEVPDSVERALAIPGRPLTPNLSWEMSQRFGHDFSRVQVHSGEVADESAREIQAAAYTVGPHIVFGGGRFAPETEGGRRLIAHELAHVVQQSRSGAEWRIYRQSVPNPVVPAPLDLTTEAAVARVFDRLAEMAGVKVATEVNIAVLDQAGNWVLGRIDRIVKLADGTIKGVELKLDATSSRTSAQEIYIPLANEGSIVEITGYAADQLNLPPGTRITLNIQIISSENVASAMEELGLKPESLPRVIRRAAGTKPPAAGPSGFETARESAEEVPRSPKAVRVPREAPAAAAGESVADLPVVRPRTLAYEAPAAEPSSMTGAASTALGVATPVVGVVDELLVGEDMARIRSILGKGRAPNNEENVFMASWGLIWDGEDSYGFASVSWWLYWAGKWFLNPWVLLPERDPHEWA